MPAAARSALVVGGSLAGLSSAIWLASAGVEVEVLERSPEPLEDHGAGIVLHPSTSRFLLEREGLSLEALSLGVRHLRYIGPDGEVVSESPSRLRFSSYGVLYRHLRQAARRAGIPYRLGAAVARVGSEKCLAWVELAGGARRQADLVIGADGVRSTVRRTLFPHVEPELAGYVAWRGVHDEGSLDRAVAEPMRDAITYCILERSHLLTYPIASPSGRLLRNWVWYCNVADELELDELRVDRQGVLRDLSVPAGWLSDAALARLRCTAQELLPPPLRSLVRHTPAPFLQVVVDVKPDRLVAGRACTLGDAGFVARPHAAAGTAKAAEEAWLLAQSLASHTELDEALSSWEAEALELGSQLVERSRRAGERAQHEGSWKVGEALPFGLRRIGDSEDW